MRTQHFGCREEVFAKNSKKFSRAAWQHRDSRISWADVEQDIRNSHQGHNVIIHEIAHKLDIARWRQQWHAPLHYRMPILE
jgi:Mlc titration factor MtfA (ptsG expression regulator)